jgi:methyl-accepting chemotaxis protein
MWVSVVTLGILACLGGVFYTFFVAQKEAGQESEYRVLANDMRLVQRDVVVEARATALGEAATFSDLEVALAEFDALLANMQGAGIDSEIADIQAAWQPVKRSAQVLVAAGDDITFIRGVSRDLESNIRPIQSEFAAVVDILRDEDVSAGTVAAAQKTLWLTERIARNIDRILAGGDESQAAADELRQDAASFNRIVEALKSGDRVMGIERLTDPDALDSINTASQLFSAISRSSDQIAGASGQMREVASARETLVASTPSLAQAIAAVVPALERLNNARVFDRGTLIALFGAPALLAVGLLVVMFRGQRQRVEYTESGVADINSALVRIAEGDLTVQVPEDNEVTREIAREINASTRRQRELIQNIRTPFERSVEEINKIGKTARGQVEKGRQLTRSVVESTTAATEMVRTSDEIKHSTAEAAQSSEQNRARVARGYELTKDMSSASAAVRESVQETSKSAKRQGELIQSVTNAAEYIQALNTKISVVAINTRIEAEKAGEYGRPFLGIAEAIGDLLREAEEEGRKIISEVRMLQNMSAENLESMETTVGTVVTILEYIERLGAALEEINEGSSSISAIIRSVDDAAGQSAVSAQHMNNSMAEIRERNVDIAEYSEFTQIGVSELQASMRDVADNLSQFRIEEGVANAAFDLKTADEVEHINGARASFAEDQMSAMETDGEARVSV